ncbi:class I SAM-dependent methyltransferase [Pantoea sp. ICBG 985]|uniref:class I SAM-dependent methyltransferase n=1 Tax=Pantoea sp. ICBG 985 TaxID=2071683 RepID=UPI001E4780A8|nr:class I SAM-dependent methyltransferase [Pantoea sp. ICBG 985]
MMTQNTNDIFNEEFARQYDAYNGKHQPIADNLHLLISLVLDNTPPQARVLCVGVGTGSEIIRLAQQHPEWQFTGVDPSPDMLAVCTEKLTAAGIRARCQLHQGYLNDVPVTADYDVVLCLLVTHFIQHPQRAGIYQQMQQQLKPGGRLVTAEIAGDVQDTGFDEQLLFWKTMHESASGRAQNLDEMKQMLTQRLLLLPAAQTEALMAQAGFTPPQRFFQSLLIHGWTARKR